MIYGKSNHPVEIKRISVRLWCLRDEIEAAIERRMKECEAAGIPLYIDDIKEFYLLKPTTPLNEQPDLQVLEGGKSENKDADAMASLMEGIAQDPPATPPIEAEAAAAATPAPEGTTESPLKAADEIMNEQKAEGVENKKNPLLDRPFTRQAPDSDKCSYGFCFLSDVNMECLLTFTKRKFTMGQSIVVEFLIPKPFIMSAAVRYCHFYAIQSKIISETKPDYRIQAGFTYSYAGERDKLREFLKSVEPNLPADKKKKLPPKEEDSIPT